MFSLNAPVPPAVERTASELAPELAGFDRIRDARDRTLVVKRLGALALDELHVVQERARQALAGAPACEARVAEIGVFSDPPTGRGPVVYLAVESPGLYDLHERLCATFDPVPDVEGEGYTPHVTLARGGGRGAAERLDGRSVGPVTWTVDELAFYDVHHGERAGVVRLPA